MRAVVLSPGRRRDWQHGSLELGCSQGFPHLNYHSILPCDWQHGLERLAFPRLVEVPQGEVKLRGEVRALRQQAAAAIRAKSLQTVQLAESEARVAALAEQLFAEHNVAEKVDPSASMGFLEWLLSTSCAQWYARHFGDEGASTA